MEKKTILFTRRSIRKFLKNAIKPDDLDYLVSAFLQTPTAKNQRHLHLVVIDDQSTISKIAQYHNSGAIIAQAPLLLAVTYADYQNSLTRYYMQQEIGAATLQLLLAAQSLNLGSLWIGISDKNQTEISKVLQIPDNVFLGSIVLVGEQDEEKATNDYYNEEKIHYGKY